MKKQATVRAKLPTVRAKLPTVRAKPRKESQKQIEQRRNAQRQHRDNRVNRLILELDTFITDLIARDEKSQYSRLAEPDPQRLKYVETAHAQLRMFRSSAGRPRKPLADHRNSNY